MCMYIGSLTCYLSCDLFRCKGVCRVRTSSSQGCFLCTWQTKTLPQQEFQHFCHSFPNHSLTTRLSSFCSNPPNHQTDFFLHYFIIWLLYPTTSCDFSFSEVSKHLNIWCFFLPSLYNLLQTWLVWYPPLTYFFLLVWLGLPELIPALTSLLTAVLLLLLLVLHLESLQC